jgi:hypothetical protein
MKNYEKFEGGETMADVVPSKVVAGCVESCRLSTRVALSINVAMARPSHTPSTARLHHARFITAPLCDMRPAVCAQLFDRGTVMDEIEKLGFMSDFHGFHKQNLKLAEVINILVA